MTKAKRIFIWALVLALMLSAAPLGATAAEQAPGDIVVLTTNDVHNGINEGLGYAGLAAYKKDMQASVGEENVTLVDAGDSIAGGIIGMLSTGSYIIDIMNQVGYDLAAPGNHEFDFGVERLFELTASADFPYLSSNFIDLKTQETVYEPYEIIDYGDTQVAYIGITTPESFSKSGLIGYVDENGKNLYSLCEGGNGQALYDNVQGSIDAAKTEGADYVIAVAHLGTDEQSSPWTALELAANTSGIDVLVDGHSHSVIDGAVIQDEDGGEVLHIQTGTQLANIGKIVINPASGDITAELISAASYTKKDAETQTFIDGITAAYQADLDKVIAKTDSDLTILDPRTGLRAVRNAETNVGDLCADAFLEYFGADVALLSGGGVRGSIPAGDVTWGDILTVHPYSDNMACMIEATGQQILDALELGCRTTPSDSGGFLQVAGLSYTVDATIPSSVKLTDNGMFISVDGPRRVSNVTVGGKPIEADKTYKLASFSYLAKSGVDGFSMFTNCKVLSDDPISVVECIKRYITKTLGGEIGAEYSDPFGDGRIDVYLTPFRDVRTRDWYSIDAKYVYDNGIMNGVSASSFNPGGALSRAMVVTMLYRLDGATAPASGSSFDDVKSGEWYYDAVGWAISEGIVEGYEDGSFRPDEPVSREELAVLIYRYCGEIPQLPADVLASVTYADRASIAQWALPGVAYCTYNKLMTGKSSGAFDPAGLSNRAEGATVIARLDKLLTPAEAAA